MSVPRNGLFHDPWTEINESVKTFTLHHLINMQQTANPLHTRYTACLTPAGETWLLTTQKTLSKARRLLSPLCCLLNSPHRSSRSLFPLPSSHALFIPVFRDFSPISCLINKTYLCACSLTSPSSRLVPKAKP